MNKYEILFLLKEHAEIHDTKESLESLSEQLADFCYEQSESLSENSPLHVYKDNNSFYSGMIFINYKENAKNDIIFIKEKLKNIVSTYNKIRFCINFNNKLEDLRNYF